MDNPSDTIRLTFGDSLSYGHLRQVCYTLKNGGLCILPSDTTYTIAAIPFRRDVLLWVTQLLPEKANDPIPLSFGSLAMVEEYVKLTAKDYRAIDKFCPGPITLVCKIKDRKDKSLLEDVLHTVGTIGIRIPDSPVERQISTELQRPITSCAIRDDEHNVVQDFDDAVDIVRSRMRDTPDSPILMAIRMTRIKYYNHSTVISVQTALTSPYDIHVYRPGIIAPKKIEDTIRQISFRDVEEWT